MRSFALRLAFALGGFLTPTLMLLAGDASHAQTPAATIEFLDVGQGDATLIRTPEGKVALIDAGPSSIIIDRLRERDVTKIDLLVLSHHHLDHYGGMDDVVREFRPTAFLVSRSSHTSPTYLKLLKLIRDEDVQTFFPNDDETPRKIDLGSVQITVLPHPKTEDDNENNNSIGLKVEYGKAKALLTGDSEETERKFWMANDKAKKLCEDCGLLKLAHHGSRNGTDVDWLDLVKPKTAVAMCGLDNSFHHPHKDTIDLLAGKGIPLKRTDQDGAVMLTSDGQEWSLAGPAASVHAQASAVQAAAGQARAEDDAPAGGGKINLNSATAEELKELPGVGPALAMRIIAARPFDSIDDLLDVAGIGPKKLALLRPFVLIRQERRRGARADRRTDRARERTPNGSRP